MPKHPLAFALAIAFSLGACTVGPEYVRPSTELPERFDQAGSHAATEAVQPALWRACRCATRRARWCRWAAWSRWCRASARTR